MILTWAENSHWYRVDEDGNVYTPHQFDTSGSGLGPEPGERPEPGRYRQYAGTTPFWFPTTQQERLTAEQQDELAAARELLDLHWMVVEAREQVECPECGKAALRDERVHVDGRVPFVCEERHLTIDETETPEPIYEKA